MLQVCNHEVLQKIAQAWCNSSSSSFTCFGITEEDTSADGNETQMWARVALPLMLSQALTREMRYRQKAHSNSSSR
jgi:hypothetical protein